MVSQAADFFGPGSPFLRHPLLTEERTRQEVDHLLRHLALGAGDRVLDVGCGWGRHSVEMARRGLRVTGIDPAEAMIQAARARAEQAGVAVDLRRQRGETFTTDRPYDAVLCLFSSLGQVNDGRDNRGLVGRAHGALGPGGHFVVEVNQREPALAALRPTDCFREEGRETRVARCVDPANHVVTECFAVVSPAEERLYTLRYYLFDREELENTMRQAGFAVVQRWRDYAGAPLLPESTTMILVGRA